MSSRHDNPIPLSWSLRVLRSLPLPRKLGLLERIYGRGLAKFGVVWVRTQKGPCWKLDLGDVSHRWIVYGDYEGRVQMNWITQWLAKGGVVVDSGANIGEMALYFSAAPGVDLLCVEPVAQNFKWLTECIEANHLSNTRIANVALGAEEGYSDIQIDSGRSTLQAEWYSGKSLSRNKVRLTTLDILAESYEIARVRLWKLDVEGWEVPALLGADRLLRERRIDALLIEITPQRFAGIQDVLMARGYRLGEIRANGIHFVDSARHHGNLVALPTRSVSEVE